MKEPLSLPLPTYTKKFYNTNNDTDVDANSDDEGDEGDEGDEDIASTLWNQEEYNSIIAETRNSINTANDVYIIHVLRTPPQCDWYGRNGTISHICDQWNFSTEKKMKINRILSGVEY